MRVLEAVGYVPCWNWGSITVSSANISCLFIEMPPFRDKNSTRLSSLGCAQKMPVADFSRGKAVVLPQNPARRNLRQSVQKLFLGRTNLRQKPTLDPFCRRLLERLERSFFLLFLSLSLSHTHTRAAPFGTHNFPLSDLVNPQL